MGIPCDRPFSRMSRDYLGKIVVPLVTRTPDPIIAKEGYVMGLDETHFVLSLRQQQTCVPIAVEAVAFLDCVPVR